ncbi:facilitated trehalose transporter Tret1-like [Bicyclus anynana]|uniref:Facilitated trehalose transporter Tret1-like n=1 Tax=Bicyclus anynana TaxID=110368 RepID=A0ABM3LNI3_BICAN|nr:facilitated trehalose transporter Tret1-like [Bicyclus anynana]
MDGTNVETEAGDVDKHVKRIYFSRQVFSCGAIVLNYLMYGMYMGAPTVIIPQLRREANSTDVVTPEMASWLSSISAYCGIPWAFILPMIAFRYGRKIILVAVTITVLIGNIIFYCSTSVIELLVSQAIQGILAASIMTITVMVMSEYTSPKYRGVLLAVKSATFYWGVWIANAIGTFYNWRNIGIVIFVCIFFNFSSIFYKESPYWLATNGRFEECARIHRWLKGTGEESEKELRKLILSQQDHLNNKTEFNKLPHYKKHIKIINIVKSKSFHKPLFYAILPTSLVHLSGKVVYTIYAIDIIKKITSSEETAYEGMLILDGVTVLGMYFGCSLARFMRRRTQLILFTCIGVAFLYILSVYMYMIKLGIILEDKYLSLFLLTAFSISIGGGPMILSSCCASELAPLRYRSYFLCCLTLFNSMLLASTVKFSPLIFKNCGTHGAFLVYAISTTIVIVLVSKYMPETKDKTIQEIQERITQDGTQLKTLIKNKESEQSG